MPTPLARGRFEFMLAKSDVEQLQVKLVAVALNRLFGDFRLMALLPKQKSRKTERQYQEQIANHELSSRHLL
ncbi:hypothetical protein FORC73_1896 [Vibrio cholerae]|nr:hypothetical protein FORC73_1896 [Vibrio cholerae]EEO04696.1 hypothetical protein VIF_000176 [Vibrio cholerae TM 11079-80]